MSYEISQTSKRIWCVKRGDHHREVIEQAGPDCFSLAYPYSSTMNREALCELHAVLGEALIDIEGLPRPQRDHEKAAPAF